MDLILLSARVILAVVFALAAVTKLVDRAGSRQAVADFGVPQVLANPISGALPFAELAVMVTLLVPATAWWGTLGALALLLFFIAGISVNLARGNTPDCHCFGQLYSEPIGIGTVVRNGILALVAAFAAIVGFHHSELNPVSWLAALTGVERVALSLAAFSLLAAAAQWWLLLRPPSWLADKFPSLGSTRMVEKAPQSTTSSLVADDAVQQPGLPVGSPAPRFRLPGLYGETMTLDALRAGGRAVMLVFVSPSCGPCAALMPDIARWQIEYSAVLRFVLVSSGTALENRAKTGEHEIAEILLQKSFEVGTVYRISGTPGALIIRADGTIGSPVAGGADQIRALLDQYVELLATQAGIELEDEGEYARALRAAASPLEIGADAPDLTFSDLRGKTVRLTEFRGKDTAVLFWSPTCTFCQEMEPALAKWEEERPAGAPELLIVLDGAPAADEPVSLRSTAVIDHESEAATALSNSGTPTAVLIDADGKIASQPAVGAEAIRPLLGLSPGAALSAPIAVLDRIKIRPTIYMPAKQQYLVVGSSAPDVVFTDLRGGDLRVSDFRGTETLLLFWNAGNDICRHIEPHVQAWETGRSSAAPDLVVVVPGSVGSNQLVHIGSFVVIDNDGSGARAIGVKESPAAVLIDANGNIASELAAGAAPVLRLLAMADEVQCALHGNPTAEAVSS